MSDELIKTLIARIERLENKVTDRFLDLEKRLSRIETVDWMVRVILTAIATVVVKEVFF